MSYIARIFGYIVFVAFIIGVSTGKIAKAMNNLIDIAGKEENNERDQIQKRNSEMEETD